MMERIPKYRMQEEGQPLDQEARGTCGGYQGHRQGQGGGGPGKG